MYASARLMKWGVKLPQPLVFTLLSHPSGMLEAVQPCPASLPARLATAGSCSLAGKPQPAGQPWMAATEGSHS